MVAAPRAAGSAEVELTARRRERRTGWPKCHALLPSGPQSLAPKREKSELERLEPLRVPESLPHQRDEGGDQKAEEPRKAVVGPRLVMMAQPLQLQAVIASQGSTHLQLAANDCQVPMNRPCCDCESLEPKQRCSAASEHNSTTRHVDCEQLDEVQACQSTPVEPSTRLRCKVAWKVVIAVKTKHQISIRCTAEREHERERLAVQLVVRRTCRCRTGSATIGLAARRRRASTRNKQIEN